MIAFAFASICVPYDRIVVTTAGRPVGIAEMANAIAAVNTRVEALAARQVEQDRHGDGRTEMKRIWPVNFLSWT